MRSVATMSRRSPAAYTSRTLPRPIRSMFSRLLSSRTEEEVVSGIRGRLLARIGEHSPFALFNYTWEFAMKLSILLPVYNERTVVERCIAQVLTAPLPENMERELVIVDDRSTDGTWNI